MEHDVIAAELDLNISVVMDYYLFCFVVFRFSGICFKKLDKDVSWDINVKTWNIYL